MRGQLLTHDFLLEGITQLPAWQDLDDAVLDRFQTELQAALAHLPASGEMNEADTEADIIVPILNALGWTALLRQQSASSRRVDVPDLLLFPNDAAKAAAAEEAKDSRRYRHGLLMVESKRWDRPLDRGVVKDLELLDPTTPSNQILRYLSISETASEGAIVWGILTNGRIWRLYWQKAQSRSEDFLEIDLAWATGLPGVQGALDLADMDRSHQLRTFALLFGRAAFDPQQWDDAKRTLHGIALDEAGLWESKVSRDLGGRVFAEVFPRLAAALVAADPDAPNPANREYLLQVRDAALILLYRLLFVFYAEDRDLLPVRDRRYDDYSLRKLRREIAVRLDHNDTFSERGHPLWDRLSNLFAAISAGDASLGLPAYNGGLFEALPNSLVRRAHVPDAALAPIIDALSRRPGEDNSKVWINYRDLSVQHLGSVYERLLDFALIEEGSHIIARPQSFARRTTGSYYTHDDLVQLIIRTTVGPLIRERIEAFRKAAEIFKRKRVTVPADNGDLAARDPANAILDLKICDPAMGSGHFLVALVDFLADQVLEAVALATVEGSRQDFVYRSPLLRRLEGIRSRILAAAKQHHWAVSADHLDDRHIIRRMILKRVIYGVDKNPMAVELAKVALWLHTFTVGAPLSFLDHHLRCGDSLHGERMETVREELNRMGNLLSEGEITRIRVATSAMQEIAELTDIDVAEAHRSKALLDQIDRDLAPLKSVLDFWRGLRWLIPDWSGATLRRRNFEAHPHAEALIELFSGGYTLERVLEQETLEDTDLFGRHARQVSAQAQASRLIRQAKGIAAREHFLHWEIAFPTVWADADENRRGFDAIIGNPPWDRIKLQEVEWFAERRPAIAMAARAADRKRMINALKVASDPLYSEYLEAVANAETAARVARECDDYPLLSGGDINLYSLFVERSASLIRPVGIVGLLTPSGIAADKSAADFFKSISQTGRLGTLFDFENKKIFFPDIHASFKFCSLVFGGEHRLFERSACAFYLHDVRELATDRVLELSAEDFAIVNPNTGGAPIFRTRRDADITIRVYREFPILVDRRPQEPRKLWAIRYMRMFDMTNDSNLFLRKDELVSAGWYPVEGNHWKKGDAQVLPLYVGRMIHQFDHRSADVSLNEENLHNAAFSGLLDVNQKLDSRRYPEPQFWITESAVPEVERRNWVIGFRDIARATDVRTMIACIVPTVAAGNTLPILPPEESSRAEYAQFAPLLLANLNSLAFDFLARQKTQSTHMNWYIVEQLPVIPPSTFRRKIGKFTIADFVRGEVLRLSYTAWDLQAFAKDLGYEGPPFDWDEDDRRHRLARLDALFFHLYNINKEDAAYILDTFPIVREHDERAFGRYRTKEMVLAYMAAVEARDLETVVDV